MHFIIFLIFLQFTGIIEAGELWTKYDLPDTINCVTGYDNHIWGGTQNGVFRVNRDDGNITRFTEEDGIAGKNITKSAFDYSGNLYIASKDNTGGISIFKNSSWISYRKDENGLIGNDITGISVGKDNTVWISVNKRDGDKIHCVQSYTGSKWITYFTKGYSVSIALQFTSIAAIDSSDIFVSSNQLNFYEIYRNEGVISERNYGYEINQDGSIQNIQNIVIEENKSPRKIWINGTFIYNFFSEKNIIAFYEGDWQINPRKKWILFSPQISGFTHCDTPIIIDNLSNKWLVDRDESNKKYLIKYDDVNYIPYNCPSWTDSTEITALYADDQGFIWVGTQAHGLWRFDAKNATIVQAAHEQPAPFTISSPYPNPFNAQTTISFTLTKPAKVNLSIYSLTGQKVRALAAGSYSTGKHTMTWDGKNEQGEIVSSGLYLARMESDGVSKVVRMTMVK